MIQLEVLILFCMGLIWILFATIEDIRTREIANWLNISLAVFALVFRFFYSMFELNNYSFFLQGVLGLLIFFVLGNILYYAKMFAGGDAKLMMALGAILPFTNSFGFNLKSYAIFFILFLFVGAVYGLFMTFLFGFRNFSRLKVEFRKQFYQRKSFVFSLLIISFFSFIFGYFYDSFFYFGIFVFIMPFFYLFVKSVDEACMVKNVSVGKLTLGDWLYEDVKVGSKIVKATWDGITEDEMKLLKKKDRVLIRYGIQFAPVFLLTFILWFFWFLGIITINFF